MDSVRLHFNFFFAEIVNVVNLISYRHFFAVHFDSSQNLKNARFFAGVNFLNSKIINLVNIN